MADTATWVALGVAAYAAGVSTYHEIVGRIEKRKALERGVRVTGRGRLRGDPLHPAQLVRVVSTKTRPIEIARVGVVLANGLSLWQPPARDLPVRLNDGESVEVELREDWLLLVEAQQAEVAGFIAEDSHGTVYRSAHESLLGGSPS